MKDVNIDIDVSKSSAFLKKAIDRNGIFSSLTSYYTNFRVSETTESIFPTTILLGAIGDIYELKEITRSAIYLLKQRSARWTWNYWERGSKDSKKFACPDDIDCTAAALTGIAKAAPEKVTGAVISHLVKNLTQLEVQPGGPYRTWLVRKDAPEVWQDVDLAVNASLGRFLAMKKIHLPLLSQYVEKFRSKSTL